MAIRNEKNAADELLDDVNDWQAWDMDVEDVLADLLPALQRLGAAIKRRHPRGRGIAGSLEQLSRRIDGKPVPA